MSIKTRAQLKAYYETGDVPNEAQYGDFVDSVPNLADDKYIVGFQLKGDWVITTAYILNDLVLYNGSSYACILYNTGELPTNTTYWTRITAEGNGIVSIVKTSTVGLVDTYTITYTDSTTETFDVTNGATGTAATIAVGIVTTLAAGQPATVTNVGSSSAAIFDIAIPQGEDGTDATGDVNGPGTNSADYIPQWDGANSKTLKNGLAVPAGGLAGLTALGDKAPLASPTFTGLVTTPAIKITTGASLGKVLTSDADGDATWETPSVSADSTTTFTNKRITPRITTITSHATPTINTDNCDAVTITAQAEAITSMTTNLSGTPTNFQKLIIRIKDNGTARAITWGASFEAKGVALPTTTVLSKVLTVGFIYDTVTSKWGCVASAQEA